MFHHCDVLIVGRGLHTTHTLGVSSMQILTPLSQFSVKMFSGDEKFSLESLYIQMHVHILTANY